MPEAPDDAPGEDLEDLYENAPCGYLSTRADGSIVKVNATFAGWIGFPADRLVGTELQSLLTVGTRIFFETHAAPLLALQGRFDEVSLELKTAGGDRLPVFVSAVQRTPPGGRAAFTRVTVFRAQERRRYERELVEAREAARAAEATVQDLLRTERRTAELREQFIAVLGHDLRNPLTSIGGGATLLAKTARSERDRRILAMVQGSVMRMSALIDNVLDFARGRLGGGLTLTRRPDVALEAVLQQVLDELRIGLQGRDIATDIALPDPVDCDPVRIAQLASNLVGNALTHGAPGAPVRVRASTRDGWLEIEVTNGGKAITPATMERLFQPFVRGEAGPRQQGLGLGLHIASEIASAHGGTLAAASSEAETRFTFRMPLSG